MGYLPNAAAQALKTNRSFNIGVLLEDDESHGLLNQFFVTVLEGFRVNMEAKGYDLMLTNHTVGKRRISYLEHCRHSNLDGVFIECSDFEDPELLELAGSDVPWSALTTPMPAILRLFPTTWRGYTRRSATHAPRSPQDRLSAAPFRRDGEPVNGYRRLSSSGCHTGMNTSFRAATGTSGARKRRRRIC